MRVSGFVTIGVLSIGGLTLRLLSQIHGGLNYSYGSQIMIGIHFSITIKCHLTRTSTLGSVPSFSVATSANLVGVMTLAGVSISSRARFCPSANSAPVLHAAFVLQNISNKHLTIYIKHLNNLHVQILIDFIIYSNNL